MKHIILLLTLTSLLLASLNNINSFQADFKQSVTDDKGKKLTYAGHVIATKPQNALWNYTDPIKKDIYINSNSVTVIEPEIEQVIIRKIESNFDFFKMIHKAKKTGENTYITSFRESKFIIILENNLIKSISYNDEFDNGVEIIFEQQIQNMTIDKAIFTPQIPLEFDVIRD